MNKQYANTKQMTIVSSGLRRPRWICSNVKQDAVVVRDRSLSMSGQKAKDASDASRDLVVELADPANKGGFSVAIVDFATRSKVIRNLESATTLKGRVPDLSVDEEGCTNITSGLADAQAILAKADRQQEGIYLRPVVLILTDGCHNVGREPHAIAAQLKGIADLVTVAFGDDADEALLRSIATTSQHFYRCSSGRDLRRFLAAVGATMGATMAANANATEALTTIQQ